MRRRLLPACLLILALCLALPAAAAERETLFQVSTIDALLNGVYGGQLTLGRLLKHGGLGLGTFDALDGEMVVSGGVVYRIDMRGRAHVMPAEAITPFAAVTFFEADQKIALPAGLDFAGLKKFIGAKLTSPNLFYAVRVKGSFASVKARSVPRQNRPYPPLDQAVKHQAVFNYQDVEGELVGFICPAYVKGVGVPGWHLHFLDQAKKRGGHLLDCRTRQAVAEIDVTPSFLLRLPTKGDFLTSDLNRDQAKALHKVEQGKK